MMEALDQLDGALEAGHHVKLEVRELPDGAPITVRIDRDKTLLEFFVSAAAALELTLLPDSAAPLDTLHNLTHGGDEVVRDLSQTVGEYLRKPHRTHDFGVMLERVLFVNAQAKVAPAASMTPRQILALFGLDTNFTLYYPEQAQPLPIDAAIPITRGTKLEAQRDGKYGGAPTPAPLPQLEQDIAALRDAGYEARLLEQGGQRYVRVDGISAPTPPWQHARQSIVVAVPGAYEQGAVLDAFYLSDDSAYAGRRHKRANGGALVIDGSTWVLVSWHYPDRSWCYPRDNLFTHVLHCKRFFVRAEA